MPGADQSVPATSSLADASFTHAVRDPRVAIPTLHRPGMRVVSDGYIAALVENAVARAYKDGYDKGLSDAHDLQVSLGDSPF